MHLEPRKICRHACWLHKYLAGVAGLRASADIHDKEASSRIGSIPDLSTGSLTVSQCGQTGRWRGGRILEACNEIPLETTSVRMTDDVLQNEGLKGAVRIALTIDSAGPPAQKWVAELPRGTAQRKVGAKGSTTIPDSRFRTACRIPQRHPGLANLIALTVALDVVTDPNHRHRSGNRACLAKKNE